MKISWNYNVFLPIDGAVAVTETGRRSRMLLSLCGGATEYKKTKILTFIDTKNLTKPIFHKLS